MDKIIAYCGITCNECPAYLATQADDDTRRTKVAEQWSKEYNADISPKDIDCDGCNSESGRLFSHCRVCPIRKCSRERQLENCACCDDFGCDSLKEFFGFVPVAKSALEGIRKNRTS